MQQKRYGVAFRYLVKPLDQTLFAAAMDAVLQELNSKHFTIEYDGITMSLETSDIYFLESHGHKVLIHCKEQDLTLRMSIPEALEQLPKRCFVSPHKSYLVNMEQMLCVSYGCCRSLRFKSQVLLSVMWHSIMLRMSISLIIWSALWLYFSL